MASNSQRNWTREFAGKTKMMFPAEYVVRIFKGTYPRLQLSRESFAGKKLLDVGCGDGRNSAFLRGCGFEVSAIEITAEIVAQARGHLAAAGITDVDFRVGSNDAIPYPDATFDYLLSWSSCYYLGVMKDFQLIVREFARVLKPGGRLILQIPEKTAFIYEGSERLADGYCLIRNDPFAVRNGEVFRIFENREEIQRSFSECFTDFTFGLIHDDCFGYAYHLNLIICRRGE